MSLAGWAVLVTRPLPAAAALAAGVRAAGATPIVQPALEVVARDTRAARRALAALRPGDAVVFTSAHAVRFALALKPREIWPEGLRRFAVGERTRAAAEAAGLGATRAPTEGSGALALLPQLLALEPPPRCVLMLAAPGGRTELIAALRARGRPSAVCHVYERRPATRDPRTAPVIARHRHRLLVIATSVAILEVLVRWYPDLPGCPLVVPSERIADHARGRGFGRVAVAGGPDDDALLAAATVLASSLPEGGSGAED